MNIIRVIAVGWLSAIASLGACAYNPDIIDTTDTVLWEIDAVREMQPQGPEFNQGLRSGYLDYGDLMWAQSDYGDYYHFAFKSVESAKGEPVLPDAVESRDLPAGSVDELAAARARLMAVLGQTARTTAPWEAASAQTAFDCWVERVEENASPAEIEECRGAFAAAIAEAERSLVTEAESVYLAFFAWDQAELSPVAMTVLEQVREDYLRQRPAGLVLAGHADLSGPAEYNVGLSEQRARNVARALEELGIPGEAMQLEWYGETRPRVPTPDGVREPQNRRVEITFVGPRGQRTADAAPLSRR